MRLFPPPLPPLIWIKMWSSRRTKQMLGLWKEIQTPFDMLILW